MGKRPDSPFPRGWQQRLNEPWKCIDCHRLLPLKEGGFQVAGFRCPDCLRPECPICGHPYENPERDGTPCKGCIDAMWENQGKAVAEHVSRKWPVPPRYASANLDTDFPTQVATLDKFSISKYRTVYQAMDAFLRSISSRDNRTGMCCYLVGRNGCGKTHLACSILNGAQAIGRSTAFLPVTSLLETLRAAMSYRSEDDTDDLLRQLREIDVLCLDDVGKQRQSDMASDLLFRVVDDRYGERRPTIITTNLQVHEFASDDRFYALLSRILEDGLKIDFPAVDLRAKGKGTGERIPFEEKPK